MTTSPLLTRQETADLLKVTVRTLRNWERAGTAPPRVGVGISVRYPAHELNAWLAEMTVDDHKDTKETPNDRKV